MKRLLTATGLLAVVCIASALSGFQKIFDGVYNAPSAAKTRAMKCMVCHASRSGGKLNPYGLAIQKEMQEHANVQVTVVVLRAIEKKDSDGDGMNNLQEIMAGRAPGVKN